MVQAQFGNLRIETADEVGEPYTAFLENPLAVFAGFDVNPLSIYTGVSSLTVKSGDHAFIIEQDDINKIKVDLGENPANAIWLWGQ